MGVGRRRPKWQGRGNGNEDALCQNTHGRLIVGRRMGRMREGRISLGTEARSKPVPRDRRLVLRSGADWEARLGKDAAADDTRAGIQSGKAIRRTPLIYGNDGDKPLTLIVAARAAVARTSSRLVPQPGRRSPRFEIQGEGRRG